ncbi:CaiB/BaiF CoA-transferase family protein [Arthrobacter sp. B6]|uniref:CaiB/BaiF CoA-transferase family protein n=1 Tax=Arthrobacter sp. B6 TaxID=1570137 RepID=UPI0008340DF3|nr:CoA transferase [Arthrobacter sp. B6]
MGETAKDTGYLNDLRVLEVADELGEYCGKVLAGLGADVAKVEQPGGEKTRGYGPFVGDVEDPNQSLHFWHYNLGKRSVTLNLETKDGQESFRQLSGATDVIIDSRPRGWMDSRGIGYEALRRANPGLIYVRISHFGDDGPWADYSGSDLIHLALGGVMMNSGYDPDPFGHYDTPPIAPQMWQAYHVVGEMAVISILGALNYRLQSGAGQLLSANVHEAVSKNTETDLPDWIFLRQKHLRLTCRHSMVSGSTPALSITKDGRYLLPYRTYLKGSVTANGGAWDGTVNVLRKYEMQGDLDSARYHSAESRNEDTATERLSLQTDKLISRSLFKSDLWRDAQDNGLPWAPVRRPEENIDDEHWLVRGAFTDVHHAELDRTFTYTGAKWYSPDVQWQIGRRPPLTGEHTLEVLGEWQAPHEDRTQSMEARPAAEQILSKHGKPFALSDVRVIDLSWMLASAGAGRFLTAMGAEVIKVEHASRLDGMRTGLGACPPGGRAERDAATEPLPTPTSKSPNRGGSFMEINAGKLGMSLNLKSAEGKAILEDLIRGADMVVEGFSPGTMDRMGLGYERLKELNPKIIYVQQSGFGQYGTYGRARAFGPTAQAFTGISEMSGLPEPFPPAGIGYSYLDWVGAYNMSQAMLAALYRRNITGNGCHIDASQGEAGLYLTGTAILDWSVNKRQWSRYGNRSPYKPAAPHGAYRTVGSDRWISVAAFTEDHWQSLTEVLGHPAWTQNPRFADLQQRLDNQDELDAALDLETRKWDGYELMSALQIRGVPAGVCQDAQDRYETDPQLKHLQWLVELDQTEIGTWPVKEHPVRMEATPAYMGGRLNRSGPNYGEDTDYVLSEILGFDDSRIEELRQGGVV